jgi:hypothetical protein
MCSHCDSIDSATTCVTSLSKPRCPFVPASSAHAKVVFDESRNVFYHDIVTPEVRRTLWYSRFDMGQIKKDSISSARSLRRLEMRSDESESWSRALSEYYKGLCDLKNSNDMKTSAGSKVISIPTKAVGLEKFVVWVVDEDGDRRHRKLMRSVKQLQTADFPDESTRAEHICRTSQNLSCVSRSYACHVAKAIAQQEQVVSTRLASD